MQAHDDTILECYYYDNDSSFLLVSQAQQGVIVLVIVSYSKY